jgi:hypothetical protein
MRWKGEGTLPGQEERIVKTTVSGQEEGRVTMSPSTCTKERGRGTILPGQEEGRVTKSPYEGMNGRVRATKLGQEEEQGQLH